MGDGADRIDLAPSLAEVARVLKAEDDVDATLTKLRVLIEQAKGKLSAEGGISIDAAFEVLRDRARSNNVKIRSVAQEVVEDLGRLPQPEPAADH